MLMPFDVVLVAPPAKVIREEYFDAPSFPEIGIAYVGGYIERHGIASVLLIDARLERLDHDATVQRVLECKPRIVGLTAFTHLITSAALLAERIKAADPGIVVVIGGYHASSLPEPTLREFPIFDYLVAGEGEMAFAKLVEAVMAGERDPQIPGVFYRRGDVVHGLGRGEIPPHLDELGEPAWHLYDPEIFKRHVSLLPIMSLRGCPFSCNFCSRPYGQSVRRRTPSKVVDEIERNVTVYGVRSMRFHDETFSVHKKHVVDMANDILARKLDIQWTATVHANTINLELATLMKQAGCTLAGYGVESGDDQILASMNKGVNKKRLLEAAEIFRAAGLPFSALFIFGHPNETLKTIWASVRFAVKLKPDTLSFGIMVPYPGTDVWRMATKGEGGYVKLSPNWDDYNKFLGNAVELKTVSRSTLEFMQVFGYLYVLIMSGNFKELRRILVEERTRAFSVFGNMVMKLFRRETAVGAERLTGASSS